MATVAEEQQTRLRQQRERLDELRGYL